MIFSLISLNEWDKKFYKFLRNLRVCETVYNQKSQMMRIQKKLNSKNLKEYQRILKEIQHLAIIAKRQLVKIKPLVNQIQNPQREVKGKLTKQTYKYQNCQNGKQKIQKETVELAVQGPNTSEQLFFLDQLFIAIYTAELILKVLGMGFVLTKNSYLRDPWNVLDFIIVISAYFQIESDSSLNIQLNGLRVFRVLRPLRTIQRIEGLKVLVTALLSALPLLRDTIIILLFFFIIYSIAGVHVFSGYLKRRCVNFETGIPTELFCGGSNQCQSSTQYCGKRIENPDDGITNFDNLLYGILTVFQCVTLEGWSNVMMFVEMTYGQSAIIYFIPLVFIGAFFLLNLTLAVINSKFTEAHKEQQEKNIQFKLKQKNRLYRNYGDDDYLYHDDMLPLKQFLIAKKTAKKMIKFLKRRQKERLQQLEEENASNNDFTSQDKNESMNDVITPCNKDNLNINKSFTGTLDQFNKEIIDKEGPQIKNHRISNVSNNENNENTQLINKHSSASSQSTIQNPQSKRDGQEEYKSPKKQGNIYSKQVSVYKMAIIDDNKHDTINEELEEDFDNDEELKLSERDNFSNNKRKQREVIIEIDSCNYGQMNRASLNDFNSNSQRFEVISTIEKDSRQGAKSILMSGNVGLPRRISIGFDNKYQQISNQDIANKINNLELDKILDVEDLQPQNMKIKNNFFQDDIMTKTDGGQFDEIILPSQSSMIFDNNESPNKNLQFYAFDQLESIINSEDYDNEINIQKSKDYQNIIRDNSIKIDDDNFVLYKHFGFDSVQQHNIKQDPKVNSLKKQWTMNANQGIGKQKQVKDIIDKSDVISFRRASTKIPLLNSNPFNYDQNNNDQISQNLQDQKINNSLENNQILISSNISSSQKQNKNQEIQNQEDQIVVSNPFNLLTNVKPLINLNSYFAKFAPIKNKIATQIKKNITKKLAQEKGKKLRLIKGQNYESTSEREVLEKRVKTYEQLKPNEILQYPQFPKNKVMISNPNYEDTNYIRFAHEPYQNKVIYDVQSEDEDDILYLEGNELVYDLQPYQTLSRIAYQDDVKTLPTKQIARRSDVFVTSTLSFTLQPKLAEQKTIMLSARSDNGSQNEELKEDSMMNKSKSFDSEPFFLQSNISPSSEQRHRRQTDRVVLNKKLINIKAMHSSKLADIHKSSTFNLQSPHNNLKMNKSGKHPLQRKALMRNIESAISKKLIGDKTPKNNKKKNKKVERKITLQEAKRIFSENQSPEEQYEEKQSSFKLLNLKTIKIRDLLKDRDDINILDQFEKDKENIINLNQENEEKQKQNEDEVPIELKKKLGLPDNLEGKEIDQLQVRKLDSKKKKRQFVWSGQDVLDGCVTDDQSQWVVNKLNSIRVWPQGFPGFLLRLKVIIKSITESAYFETLMILSVLANTIVLSLDGYGSTMQQQDILSDINFCFTIIFIVEMIFKLIAIGPKRYAKDKMNYLDGLVVILSVIELGIDQSNGGNGKSSLSVFRTVRIFRIFRILRVARLLSVLESMQLIIGVIQRSLTSFIYIAILLFLFIFIYALLGMQIFGGKFNQANGELPRGNFDTFSTAFITTFQVLTIENWQLILHDSMSTSQGKFIPALFFVSWIFIGNFILLNLFLAILLDSFIEEETSKNDQEEQQRKKEQEKSSQNSSTKSKKKKSSIFSFANQLKKKQSSIKMIESSQLELTKQNEVEEDQDIEDMDEEDFFKLFDQSGLLSQKAMTNETSLALMKEMKLFVVWLMFAILGVNLFSGKFFYCSVDRYYIDTKIECIRKDGQWKRYDNNFDDVGKAMMTLFIVASQENWPDIMFQAQDSTKENHGPQRDASHVNAYYFIVFMLIGSYFFLNFFIGVLFMKYKEAQRNEKKGYSEEHLMWMDMQKMIIEARPDFESTNIPKQKWRKKLHSFVTNSKFDLFVMTCIFLNMVDMASTFETATTQYSQILDQINIFFSCIFIIEAILKMIAFGTSYFRSSWNIFDFTVVCSSLMDIIMSQMEISSSVFLRVGPQLVRVLRVLRISRVLRLIGKYEELQALIQTIMFSLPSLMNVLGLLFVIMFMFAILGVQFFRDIKRGNVIDEFNNFWNFGNAMIILFRMSTGESWPDIMYDCMRIEECIPGQTCGTPYAPFYFLSFIVVIQYVMLNLFVLVILEQFDKYYLPKDNIMAKFKKDLQIFKITWQNFTQDRYRCLKLKESQLPQFFQSLQPPLGMPSITDKDLNKNLLKMGIRSEKGYVYFNELLYRSMKRIYGQLKLNKLLQIFELKTQYKVLVLTLASQKKGRLLREQELLKNMIDKNKSVNPFLTVMFVNIGLKIWYKYSCQMKAKKAKSRRQSYRRASKSQSLYDVNFRRKSAGAHTMNLNFLSLKIDEKDDNMYFEYEDEEIMFVSDQEDSYLEESKLLDQSQQELLRSSKNFSDMVEEKKQNVKKEQQFENEENLIQSSDKGYKNVTGPSLNLRKMFQQVTIKKMSDIKEEDGEELQSLQSMRKKFRSQKTFED